MESLLTTQDPDWASFQNQDADFYVRAAGAEVRRHCGWHIFPSVTETVTDLRIGSQGIIELPSMHVTAVASVALQTPGVLMSAVTLDPGSYTWFDYGVIEAAAAMGDGWSGFYYGPGSYAPAPTGQYGLATVTFTHGYAAVPDDVKSVVFELASSALEMNAGNVKSVETPGFRLQPTQNFGVNLNREQMSRLASYAVPAVR